MILRQLNNSNVIILIWTLLVGITSLFSTGWLQPDEQARVMEVAHYVVYGFASLPWELTSEPQIVSFFLGVLVAPILLVTKFLGLNGEIEASAIRFAVGVFASSRYFAMLQIFKLLNLKFERRRIYIFLCAMALFGPWFIVRTSQENFGATFLVWAFLYHLKLMTMSPVKKSAKAFFFGILISLAVSSRLQLGPSAACLVLYTMYKTDRRYLLGIVLGILLGLVPLAIVDSIYSGRPFSPALHYLLYALSDEEGGAVWGVQPWWYYVQQYFEAWYPPFSILLLIPLCLGFLYSKSLLLVFGPFVIVHMILGHKEARYFSCMVPFMQLATFVGWERFETLQGVWARRLLNRRVAVISLWIFASVGLLACFVPLNTSPAMYSALGQLQRSGVIDRYTYLGNTKSPPSEFFTKSNDRTVLTEMVTLNDFKEGHELQGWVAMYAGDPDQHAIFKSNCKIFYSGVSEWQIRLLRRLPSGTPIRRRINMISHCDSPVRYDSVGGLNGKTPDSKSL